MITRACQHLTRWATAVAAGVVCLGTAAWAGPGDNIQLGNATTLSPDIDLGFQYRSNITQSQTGGLDGVALMVAPGARLEHLTPDTELTLSGDYRLVKYFTQQLSQADQFNDFDISAQGRFLKTRPVGFAFYERAALVNNNADRLGNTPFHTRFRNQLEGGLELRPGAVLQIKTNGAFLFDSFRVPEGAQAGDARAFNTRIGAGANWDAEWRFFPRTAVVLEGDVTRYSWSRNWIPEGDRGTFLAMPDSTYLRVMPGIRGRFTERLVLVGQLGYGIASYDDQSVIDACTGGAECDPTSAANPFGADARGLQRLLAVAEVQYTFDEGRVLSVGYRKDFDDVFFTNFMAYNRVYSNLRTQLGTKVLTDVGASLRQESYRGEINRNDVFLDLRGDASYFLQDWARVTAGMTYQQRLSASSPNVEYNDVQARLLMTFAY